MACMTEDYKTRFLGDNNPNFKDSGKRKCGVCGVVYESYNKTSKYCSWSCAGKSEANLEKLRKISENNGKRNAIRKKQSKSNGYKKQYKPSPEIRPCNRCGELKAKKGHLYCKGCKIVSHLCKCRVCGKDFRFRVKKKTCSDECLSIDKSVRQKGSKSHLWEGGKTSRALIIRSSSKYKKWRTSVFERDNYTCVICNVRGGKLNADHIKPFSIYPELVFDINNGRTLCFSCHTKTDTWGVKAKYQKQQTV